MRFPCPWPLAALLFGCGTDIAQTAERLAGAAFPSCDAPGALVLPKNGAFGTGSEPASILVGSGYRGSEGPGLFVTARDGFRVLLNGDLVVESTSARAPTFVPLSLLPGDNAIAVVIAAKSGPPTALVHLDELEHTTVSDDSWRVTTSPTAGFAEPGYDDSKWPEATDYGGVDALPGCDPGGAFPEHSEARWIGPAPGTRAPVVLRRVVRIAPIGFGAATTGGGSTQPVLVETWDELEALAMDPETPAVILLPDGEHDFRDDPSDVDACPSTCSNDPEKPQYTLLTSDQTCAVALVPRPRDDRQLRLGSNKTLVGLGRGARVRGLGIDFGSSQNVIVRNLALYDVNHALIEAGDAFSLYQASRVWLDHSSAKWVSDGFTDVGAGSRDITLSWMHYDGVTPDECNGQHTRAVQVTDANVTIHHSFFDHVLTHSPTVVNSMARVHLLNNVLADNLGYGVGSNCGAEVLMEGNLLERVAVATSRSFCDDDTALGKIGAPDGSNFYGEDVGASHGGDGEPNDPVTKPTYAYTVEAARDAFARVVARAGAGGPWAVPLSLD